METYQGHVRTPADAIILFEACRLGLLPRVQRRLSERERQQIKSGSVFVWDEHEAGMRRWTDGKSWSASRVSGSFLTYREMEGKRGGSTFVPSTDSPAMSVTDSPAQVDIHGPEGQDGYRYKPNGLMKQSFSITTSEGRHLHLISYFARSLPSASTLMQPSNDPALRNIRPPKGMYPETTLHETQNMPAVTRSPMAGSPFATSPYSGSPGQQMGMQQQNYLRHPPPSQQHHMPASSGASPAYGYPISPLSTPPVNHHYSPNQHAARPPPGSTGHSPLYQSQSAYPQQVRVQPGPTAFDRAPPPMGKSSLHAPPPPPAPPTPQHYGGHQPLPQYNGYNPQYNGNPPPPPQYNGHPPPRHEEQPSLPPPPNHQQYQALPPYRYPNSHSPPQTDQSATHWTPNGQYRPPDPAPTWNIDPRLTATPSPQEHPSQSYMRTVQGPPPSVCRAESGDRPAGTIPSIGNLMNQDVPVRHDLSHMTNSQEELYGRNLNGQNGSTGKKPGMGEDLKALSKLNSVFAA